MVAQKTAKLKKAIVKIKQASLDTIHHLAQAAEYRDKDMGAHIVRIGRYSAIIAREMGLSDQEIENILYAAPMHDVGKIGIPDYILLKLGKLDADEWEIMEKHTTIGAEILTGSDAEFIRLAEVIALTHHEKWDGSGYPMGLFGSEIPLAGRIVAIADVFDALTSKRPYKEPYSVEKSFDIIREDSGTHFAPDVVKAFFAVKDEILATKEQYRDNQESKIAEHLVAQKH
jgi:putative two-component system response regulator